MHTHLADINFILKLPGSRPWTGKNGSSIAIRVIVDDIDSLHNNKEHLTAAGEWKHLIQIIGIHCNKNWSKDHASSNMAMELPFLPCSRLLSA